MWTFFFIPAVFALDQVSKLAVLQYFSTHQTPLEIFPFFNIILAFNRGISFSFLNNMGPTGFWLLTAVISLVLVFLLLWWAWEKNTFSRICLALIIGGALGNLLDRLRLGMVVDFLDVFWHNYHWPTFNVADSFISICVILLVVHSFFTHKTREQK